MDESRIETELSRAASAVDVARSARAELRRTTKPGDESREATLAAALDLLADAGRGLRPLIAQLRWDPPPRAIERRIEKASREVQYERKQLKKMRRA